MKIFVRKKDLVKAQVTINNLKSEIDLLKRQLKHCHNQSCVKYRYKEMYKKSECFGCEFYKY